MFGFVARRESMMNPVVERNYQLSNVGYSKMINKSLLLEVVNSNYVP